MNDLMYAYFHRQLAGILPDFWLPQREVFNQSNNTNNTLDSLLYRREDLLIVA